MTPPAGGTQANRTGNTLEISVQAQLDAGGYQKIDKAKTLEELTACGYPVYSRHFPIGKGYFGNNRIVDFVIYHPDKHEEPFIIECKWQESPGSVDEKYPYLVESIELNPIDTVILLDGGGYKKEAETWLREQVGQRKRLRRVLSQNEFLKWVNQGNL